ncbi:hypothetical protein JL720_2295 [Aureococcus anophagefferens]|nr:hypothetical protein JL720_2295 [Aureococcus anophagefferens]
MMADAMSPRRVVADVDALDAADDETGPAATIAALKSLQRQIGRLDRDRYGALSRAALLRQEIGELEQSLEQLAGAARAERAHVDVRGATAAGLEACEREEKAAAALENDVAALATTCCGPRPPGPRPRRGATPPSPPPRPGARADERLAAPRRDAAATRAREAARGGRALARYESRLVKERALRDSLHEALEEMIAVNKRLAAKPRYARRTAASAKKAAKRPPLVAFLRAAPSRRRARPGPAA